MVNINEKHGIAKFLKLLNILCLSLSLSSASFADEVLTVKKDNFIVTHPASAGVKEGDFTKLANSFVETIENFAYPKVPTHLLARIKDKNIRIEFTPLSRGGGFIDPKSNNPSELHIQLNQSFLKTPAIKSRLVHEWFHALHFMIHPDESPWIREGLAQVFVAMSTDGDAYEKLPGAGLVEAMTNSTTPLKYPFNPEIINSEAYGHVFFYFYSLYKNCGGEDLFWKLAESTPKTFDEDTINQALKGSDSTLCGDFKNTATLAEIARFHNRMIYNEKQNQNRFFVVTEVPQSKIKFKSNPDLKKSFDSLPRFQPVLAAKEDTAKLKALNLDTSYQIFQLQQEYPYAVTRGTTPTTPNTSYNFVIFKN